MPRVLFVTPSFFGYESAIADAFRAAGAEPTVLDERPSNASWAKAAARVAPRLLSRQVRRHFGQALAAAAASPPDLVVVVKAELVPRWFLEGLRRLNPDVVLAFYGYDAFGHSPRGAALLDAFDHGYSFDRADAAAYGLTYKPLFHAPEYAAARGARRRHDLVFVGTVHSGRWAVCQRLFSATRDNLGFFFSPARWHHALQWLARSDVRRIPWSEVSFGTLPRAEVADRFASARAVVDVQRTGQAGLTMRTFEVLAAGAGLVTTNPAILDEPFYDPRWVHVLTGDPDDWDLDAVAAFVRSEPSAPAAALAPYTLEAWVGELLDLLPAARAVAS